MTDKPRGTINGLYIQQALHERATPREWQAIESEEHGEFVVFICVAGVPIAEVYGPRAREDADLIVRTRNTLPEHIKSFEHILFRVRYLEQRVQELEAQIGEIRDDDRS